MARDAPKTLGAPRAIVRDPPVYPAAFKFHPQSCRFGRGIHEPAALAPPSPCNEIARRRVAIPSRGKHSTDRQASLGKGPWTTPSPASVARSAAGRDSAGTARSHVPYSAPRRRRRRPYRNPNCADGPEGRESNPAAEFGWGHRRRKCRLLSAQEDPRVKAKCRGGRLVQLTRHLQLVAGLKLLQCGRTVRSPNTVDGPAVGARVTQMILNRLHRSGRHGLHIGQGGDGLTDCRWAE